MVLVPAVDGAALRAWLVEGGFLRPGRPLPEDITPLQLEQGVSCVRLDRAGLLSAAISISRERPALVRAVLASEFTDPRVRAELEKSERTRPIVAEA